MTARGRFSAPCGHREETEQGAFPVGPGVLAHAAQAASKRGRVAGVCVWLRVCGPAGWQEPAQSWGTCWKGVSWILEPLFDGSA